LSNIFLIFFIFFSSKNTYILLGNFVLVNKNIKKTENYVKNIKILYENKIQI